MPSPRKSPEGTAPALARLRRLNLIAAVFFAAQVVVLLALSKPAELPVDGAFLTGAPGMGQYGSTTLFDLRIDLVVALFLGLAATFYTLYLGLAAFTVVVMAVVAGALAWLG